MRALLLLLLAAAARADESAWAARWRGPQRGGWRAKTGSVDVTCRFRFRPGVVPTGEVSASTPTLELRYAGGVFRSAPHAPGDARFSALPRLCEYEAARNATDGAPADLLVTSSLAYLWRLWPYLLNHARYGLRAGHRVFLWVGELPKELAETVGDSCRTSVQGKLLLRDGMLPKDLRERAASGSARRLKSEYLDRKDVRALNSNHYNKIPAATAVLDHPSVGGVFYADLDSYYDRSAFRRPEDGDHGARALDYVAFTNAGARHPFWNVKGCAFYARDAPLARRLLDRWLDDRCGFKDQYPLWHAILTEAAAAGCLRYAGEIYTMRSYDAMKRGATWHPALALASGELPKACPGFRFRPRRFEEPLHRSVGPGQVLTFRYAADGARRAFNVSNVLDGTPREDDLLDELQLGALDPGGWY